MKEPETVKVKYEVDTSELDKALKRVNRSYRVNQFLPFFVFAGVATIVVLASISLAIPPLWAGLLGGSLGVYIAKTR